MHNLSQLMAMCMHFTHHQVGPACWQKWVW